MDNQGAHSVENNAARENVRAFYDQHPYPPPVKDLEDYRRRWQDEGRRRADFHLHWPAKAYQPDLKVLVAGCGASQAAKHALRQPASQVVGIDLSETSVRRTLALKNKYHLTNLELHQLPVEQIGGLGRASIRLCAPVCCITCPDPLEGLRALRDVLEPDGAMQLMLYAPYGRAGVSMIQEYCRRLGIGYSDQEIQDLAFTLAALPVHHPLARLLGESPDFQSKDALADALLDPQERSYSVPELFEFIEQGRMAFGRWVRQAPYLPQCGSLASTPHAARLAKLPLREQYAALELFRGAMLRHNLILYRHDHPDDLPDFENPGWLAYVPIRLPDTVSVQKRLPPGAAAVLINQAHTDTDLFLPVNAIEKRFIDAMDGVLTIGQILDRISTSTTSSLH